MLERRSLGRGASPCTISAKPSPKTGPRKGNIVGIVDTAIASLYPNFRIHHGSAYHYTGASGLHGIVEGHALWASSYTMLNDVSEIRHGVEEVLTARQSWLPPDTASRSAVLAVGDFLDQLEARFENLPIYLISASKKPDLVNQYQGYAGGGGYAVELGSPPILRPFETEADENLWILGWLEVIYESTAKRTYVHEIMDELVRPDSIVALAPSMGGSLQWVLEDTFATLIAVLKHEAFASEQEVRYLFTYRARPHFRPEPRGIVPFIKVGNHKGPLESERPDGLLPINGVWVGPPTSTAQRRMRSVDLLLARNYSGVRATDSELPYVP